jgi:hypothetical protein
MSKQTHDIIILSLLSTHAPLIYKHDLIPNPSFPIYQSFIQHVTKKIGNSISEKFGLIMSWVLQKNLKRIKNIASLLDVIDKESCTSFLMDDATRTITIICTTHNTKDVSIVWKGLNWESFLLRLLNMRVMFKVIVCIVSASPSKAY